MKDLRDAQDKEAELRERNVSAKDQLQRTEIRAPTSGIVQQLAIHTMGGVVRPGDVIMEIVPIPTISKSRAICRPMKSIKCAADNGRICDFPRSIGRRCLK